jgi:hypothetical protein
VLFRELSEVDTIRRLTDTALRSASEMSRRVSTSNHPPLSVRGADAARPIGLLRREFLLLASSIVTCALWRETAAQDAGSAAIGLDEFMRLSRVLTGFDDLADESVGGEYFAALTSRPGFAQRLAELWRLAGFDGATPPVTVSDLATRGVYEVPALAEIADAITGNWYSGTYLTAGGERRVATYTDALAWRSLGYRPAGPSACGGAFGHWAERPAAVGR